MPRIWTDTIDTHRRQVNDAILDATSQLIAEHGPMSVPMAAIAERAGIGRATLYKYFPDVEAILVAWHTREFTAHLQHLQALTQQDNVTLDDVTQFVRRQRHHQANGSPTERLAALAHSVAGFSHHSEEGAHRTVLAAIARLLTRLAETGSVRTDIKPAVLAQWLFYVIHAPATLDDRAVAKLVTDSLAPKPASNS